MVLLLGHTGYVGSEFARELGRRGIPFEGLSRRTFDYSNFERLYGRLRERRPTFLINAAGSTGKPNVDACEAAPADTLAGNTLLPQTIAHACAAAEVPWGHVSSGCIYTGARIRQLDGSFEIEPELMTRPEIRSIVENDSDRVAGFRETDEPNFSFRRRPCSFYSGSKALGEEAICGLGRSYLWRLRIPFNERDNARNYLSRVQRYARVYENANSISHLGDYVRACLDLWDIRAPFGIYNVTNPGFVTTRQVIGAIERELRPGRRFEFWSGDAEFYRVAAKTPGRIASWTRASCWGRAWSYAGWKMPWQMLCGAGFRSRHDSSPVAGAIVVG